jgi:hypothetical protein
VSSSNCCDPWGFHLFRRKADGTFAPRRKVTFARLDLTPAEVQLRGLIGRGHCRPHLLDWDRDGRTDLVLEDGPMSWKLHVGVGPLRGKSEVAVKPFPMPELPDRKPYDFEFADWDGDGRLDVLVAGAYLAGKSGPWLYDIYWYRNTSRPGEPTFDPPVRLLAAPAQSAGWQYEGYAVADRGRSDRPDLVVSVSRNWRRGPDGGWAGDSRLVLFRRKADPTVVTDAGRTRARGGSSPSRRL